MAWLGGSSWRWKTVKSWDEAGHLSISFDSFHGEAVKQSPFSVETAEGRYCNGSS